MSDLPKMDRLLRVIGLLSGVRHYTKLELAKQLGMSERSIRRYIESLSDSGFVVEQDKNGFVWLSKDKGVNKLLHDLLHFSKEEAYILQRAIDAIDTDNGLKTALVSKLHSVYDFKRITEVELDPQRSEKINNLVDAIEQKKRVLLHSYSSASSGSCRDRLVEPFDFTSNYKTLWAYDVEAQGCKQFKLSRMLQVEICSESWHCAENHTLLITDAFGMSDEKYIAHLEIELLQRAKQLIIEEHPLTEQMITPIDANRWLLCCPVCKFEAIGRFVLGLPGQTRVRKSEEFLEYLRQMRNCDSSL